MVFLHAEGGVMFLLLTEADINDMRGGGRTKYVDESATGGRSFKKVILSVHKDQAEIEAMLKQAGHAKLLKGMASPVPTKEMIVCDGCKGNMAASTVLDGKCIACWRELAKAGGDK